MQAQRQIMGFDRVSADGYYATVDGGLQWALPDDELDQAATRGEPRFDTILFGRRTYEMFASFWPNALDDSTGASDPHAPGRRSPAMHAMATMLNQSTKIVYSRTLAEATWNNSRIERDLDPRALEAWKRTPGLGAIVFGSGSVVSQLTRHGLVDEYQLVVSPVLLGSGQSLIRDVASSVKLTLLEAKPFRSGNVLLRYGRAT